jgi:2'-5' RNA ligase
MPASERANRKDAKIVPVFFPDLNPEAPEDEKTFPEVGEELSYHNLPLHATITPPIKETTYTPEVREATRECVHGFAPIEVETERADLFGPNYDLVVRRIIKTPELENFHKALISILEKYGVIDMTYAGENYNPHITYIDRGAENIGPRSGLKMVIGGIAVLETLGHDQPYVVADKIRMKGDEK